MTESTKVIIELKISQMKNETHHRKTLFTEMQAHLLQKQEI